MVKAVCLVVVALVAVCAAAPDLRCPPMNDPEIVILYADPEDCSAYLECDSGRLVAMRCPAGLHYNPDKEYCDYPHLAGCNSVSVQNDPRCPSGSVGNATLLPHPTNCSRYLECDNGEIIEMECPDGLLFNPELLVCDFSWAAGCESKGEGARVQLVKKADPICPQPGHGEPGNVLMFPQPSNCSQYLECDNGDLLVMECPNGLHFSPTNLVCDHPWAAGCNTRGKRQIPK